MADGGSITWRVALGGAEGARSDLRSLGPAAAEGARIAQNELRKVGGQADDVAQRYERMAAEIRRATAQAAATPMQQRIDGMVDATGAGSAKASASFFAAAETQAQALRAALNPLAVAQQRFNDELAQAQGLARAGLISTEELTQAESRLRRNLDQTTEALRRQDKERKSGLSTMRRNTLIYTASDIVSSAGSNMSASQMFLQQGPQLLQAFIIGEAGVSAGFIAAAAAAGVFALGLGGLILAQDKVSNENARLTNVLNGLGIASGATADEINKIAKSTADATTQSIAFSKTVATTFATTGQVTKANLGAATAVVDSFAAATNRTSKDALTKLAEAFRDPAKGAVELNTELHFLTASEIEHIRRLQEQGDKAGALKVMLGQLSRSLPDATSNVTGLAAAWRSVSKAISDTITGMANFGKTPTPNLQQQLKDLQAMRQNAQDGLGVPIMGDGRDASIARAVAGVDAQIAKVKAQMKAAQDRQAQATRSIETGQVAGAVDGLNPKDEQIKVVQDRQAIARRALEGKIQTDKTPEQLRAAIAAGDKEIEQIKKRGEQVDRHGAALQRDSAAMRENAAGALVVAEAYLRSDAAGMKAEAQRKASTDATRKGTDVEKRYAEQLAIAVGDAAANGAKATADLRSQADARKAVNDNVAQGLIPQRQADQAMQDEAALRPLLTAQTFAQGEALKQITAVIIAYRAALKAGHDEEARSNVLAATSGQKDTAAALQDRLDRAGRPKASREDDALVASAAARRLRDMGGDGSSADGAAYIAREVENARKARQADAAEAAGDMLRDQNRSNEAIQVEIGLIGRSAAARAAITAHLQAQQALLERGIPLASGEARAILAAVDAGSTLARQLEENQAAFSEFEDFGSRTLDTLLNPGSWDEWGKAGQRALNDLMIELVKLAALNPLKNALFNQNNPTLGSVGGMFQSIFGSKSPPGYATGTDDHPGGFADVGEHGRERVWMPPGTRVLTNAQTRAMDAANARAVAPMVVMSANAGSPNVSVHYHGSAKVQQKVSREEDGGVRIDLYEELGRGFIAKAGSNGDLTRASKTAPRLKRYGSG